MPNTVYHVDKCLICADRRDTPAADGPDRVWAAHCSDCRDSVELLKSSSVHSFNSRSVKSSRIALDDRLLQSGHSCVCVSVQHLCRHSLQKLWLHDRTKGSLKTSLQIGQVRSSSGCESMFSCWNMLCGVLQQVPLFCSFIKLCDWLKLCNMFTFTIWEKNYKTGQNKQISELAEWVNSIPLIYRTQLHNNVFYNVAAKCRTADCWQVNSGNFNMCKTSALLILYEK